MSSSPKVVDAHAHVIVPGLGADVEWDERAGVDIVLLAPYAAAGSPGGVGTHLHQGTSATAEPTQVAYIKP